MKKRRPILASIAIFSLIFLYVPSLAVAVYSFNNAKYGLAWQGFTFKWYLQLFNNEEIIAASINTLIVAGISTIIATILGTLLALGLDRFPWSKFFYKATDLLIHFPIVVPDIILAAALVLVFSLLKVVSSYFEMGMLTLVVGHITFQIAFVTLVVRSRLASLPKEITEAAHDLYASNFYLFKRITLPLLLPGILAGAMLAFTLSIDDFIISFFTHGPDSVTLPIYIFSSLKRGLNPEIHALSTIILMLTVTLVFFAEQITRMGKNKE